MRELTGNVPAATAEKDGGLELLAVVAAQADGEIAAKNARPADEVDDDKENLELARGVTANHREEPLRLLALICRKTLHPRPELRFRHLFGIEVCAGQFLWRYARNEGDVPINF